VAGLLTGVGSENVGQAAKSGYMADPAFIDNLSGKTSMTDVLSQAKEGLQNMRADRSAAYKQGIATTAADTAKLNFAPIDSALASVTDTLKVNGKKWLIGKDEVSKVKELDNVVREWRMDPSLHTPIGLDALKRRLDALFPDSPRQNQAQRAITTVRNAVKDTIVKQSPDYAQTMSGYENALSIEKEIERALSLNDKASADTAMRKLQSLSRNNVNTNYGNRLGLAQTLEDQGGVSLLPSIAGQAMNSWTPRGAFGQGTTTATLGASYFNPGAAALLPLQSPRAVGLATYGGGRVTGILARALEKMGVTPEQARNMGLLSYQAGQQQGGQ
jgi:F0F1-type ATP synthase membrane subunit c/vacuolar-type H+-ATPase subunit K